MTRTINYVVLKDSEDNIEVTFSENDKIGISNFGVYANEPIVVRRFSKEEKISILEYLIKKLENIDEVKLERNSNYLKKFSENNQNVFVGIIPTDEYILKDKLPLDATYENEKEIIQKIYENQKCTTLPILADLETHKDEYIYYKTDIHLTSLGAYYAANSILKGMNLPKLNLKDYEKNTVTKEYMGSNNSYSNAFWVTPDEIDTYINDDNLEEYDLIIKSPGISFLNIKKDNLKITIY